MSEFINAWRKEHGQIVGALSQALSLDILSDAGQKKLRELERILEGHLHSEDRDFYPVLKKAAETNAGLKQQLTFFAADMDKITWEVSAFFRKQKHDPANADLPAEFGKISAMLKSRISREESLLMTEFEKVKRSASASSAPRS